jgi:trehalose 6-phosphate phosphatase
MKDGPDICIAAGAPPLPKVDPSRDAILLDVDGTLIDIAPSPDAVSVPAALLGTMQRLLHLCGGAFALISGRTLADLDRIFAPHVFPAIGCHGAEFRRTADPGAVRVPHMAKALRQDLVALAKTDPRILIEDKSLSLALHFRGAPDRAEDLAAGAAARLRAPDAAAYRLLRGKALIEVAPVSVNKGTAVRALMKRPPFAGRRPVFLGDDITDEDVFAILPEFGGVGISVGRPMPGAEWTVSSPKDVRTWLAQIAQSVRR